MSRKLYNTKLQDAVYELSELHEMEKYPAQENEQKLGMKYERSEQEWFQYYAHLYIKYIACYKRLEDTYDQMVQPQKRRLVKEMLENVMVRLCELKRELVFNNVVKHKAPQSDFIHLDELLIDLKLNEDALEVPIPRHFLKENKEALDQRNQLHEKSLEQFGKSTLPEEEEIEDDYLRDIDLDTAIRIIQKNERGRQGIDRGYQAIKKHKNDLKKRERDMKMHEEIDMAGEDNKRGDAVIVIQKHFRGFTSREKVEKLREEEFIVLGMKKIPEDPKDPKSQIYMYNQTRIKNAGLQSEYEEEYKQALEDIKEKLRDTEAPDMKETELESRRQWINDFYALNEGNALPKKAAEYYDKDKVMKPLTPEEEEAKKKEEEDKKKEEKKKKDAKKAGKGKKAKKATPEEEFLSGRVWKGPSEVVNKIQENMGSYDKSWAMYQRDQENFEQRFDEEYAKNTVRPTVEEEVRLVADQIIAIELANLRAKNKMKEIKDKKKKKKKKKGKKEKEPKGKKAVGNRDPRELLMELTEAGIAKKLLPCQLEDFMGGFSKLGKAQQEQQELMIDPSMGHIRQIVSEYIGIPLGSTYAREKLAPVYKSFLFFGPQGSGKTMVVRALQSQCGALVLDLSPSNILERYPDKSSVVKAFYMSWKVAHEYEPCIIMVNEVDLLYPGKKKPKEAKAAAKMKKPLEEVIKCTRPAKRVVTICCTNKYEASRKDLKKIFDKKIYFPYPDYGTRILLFKTFVEQKGGKLRDSFPLSTLAHLTEGYPAGSFKIAINKVLTDRRKSQLDQRPLNLNEFIAAFSSTYCVYKQEYDKWRDLNDEITRIKEKRDILNAPKDEDAKKGGKKAKK